MNSINIVVQSFEDFKKYEMAIFGTSFFEQVNITIFCIDTVETYIYKTIKVGDKWLAATV